MIHLDLIALTDFVRGIAPTLDRARIERHLAEGCTRCRDAVAWLRRFEAVASADARYEPPVAALRSARAAFSLVQPERARARPRLHGRVTFDSFLAPAAAGVRGPEVGITRQVLYEAGDFALDLRFDRAPERTRVVLMGQIANRRAPTAMLAALPVLVTTGRTVVARSMCNEFGEFQLDYEPRRGLRLQIPIERQRRIDLSLGEVGDLNPPQRRSRRRGHEAQ